MINNYHFYQNPIKQLNPIHSTRFQNYFIVSIYSQFFWVACNNDDIIDVGDLKVVTIKFGDNKVGDNPYPISDGNK